MSITLNIKNFKSIGDVSINLSPLTILIGPPGSGKSNILDAIALLGYFTRILLVESEYERNLTNIERLAYLARFSSFDELFRDSTREVKIEVKIGNKTSDLQLASPSGRFTVNLNRTPISWDLTSLSMSTILEHEVRAAAKKEGYIVSEARLYGFDRYGLYLNACSEITCGITRWMSASGRSFPKTVLSEFGWNIYHIAKTYVKPVRDLNYILYESFEEKIETKVMKDRIVIFDYDVEATLSSLSDSILRALYYALATYSFTQYSKKYGFDGRSFLLLEEPESHMFPYLFDYLTELIVEAAKASVIVVIATHNPLLVSGLWDKMKEVSTYYVFRSSKDGSTNVVELDVKKMAEDIVTPEDIMFRSVKEVREKYAKKSSDTG